MYRKERLISQKISNVKSLNHNTVSTDNSKNELWHDLNNCQTFINTPVQLFYQVATTLCAKEMQMCATFCQICEWLLESDSFNIHDQSLENK